MLAHPHCPCSRASVGELAQIMAHAQGHVRAYVVFIKPAALPDDWDETDLRRSAAAIPGVTVIRDLDGREAAIFHAATSGQTMLYAADGRLLYSGGITGSRGHFGDNDGYNAILSLVLRGQADKNNAPVFGCSLLNDKRNECKGVIHASN